MHDESWERAVLQVLLRYYPQEVPMPTVYAGIADFRTLTDYDKEPWKDNLQPRYECWTRSTLNILRRKGLAENPHYGMWRATAKARMI
jgi:hypothetical protein